MIFRLRMFLRRELPEVVLRKIFDNRWVQRFIGWRRINYAQLTEKKLLEALIELGVERGDVLMVHSSFDKFRGIDGGVLAIIRTLFDAVGEAGTILMPTFPKGSMKTVVESKKFDVRRSSSEMGLITEVFRRMNGVKRSLHPYHSVAARGPLAGWLVEDHHKSLNPFGPRTPLGRLVEINGKILIMGVSLQWGMTVVHVVEDIMCDDFPVPIYLDEPVKGRVVDTDGNEMVMSTMVHNDEVYQHINIARVERHLRHDDVLSTKMLGGVELNLLEAGGVVKTLVALAKRGITVYSGT